MPETCENWLSCKQSCLLGSPDLRYLPGTDLLSAFQTPGEQSLINIV